MKCSQLSNWQANARAQMCQPPAAFIVSRLLSRPLGDQVVTHFSTNLLGYTLDTGASACQFDCLVLPPRAPARYAMLGYVMPPHHTARLWRPLASRRRTTRRPPAVMSLRGSTSYTAAAAA
jgi:hypothetical protein